MAKTNLQITTEAVNRHQGLEIFSKEYERSIYNLVPSYVQDTMDIIPKEYFVLPEKELHKLLKPCHVTKILRIAFWKEYERAQMTGTRMQMVNVYDGICDHSTFAQLVSTDVERMGWILRPPTKWAATMEAVLQQSAHLMLEAVYATNVIDANGNILPKNLDSVMRVADRASIVVHGLPTLRTETKSMNVNINQSTPPPAISKAKVDELERELDQLNSKDVTPMIEEKK